MKEIVSASRVWISLALLFPLCILAVYKIKTKGNSMRVLDYVLAPTKKLATPITLDLFEAESYNAAVVVQQLVGNLVYYSNHGRYEPRIAESWTRETPTKWVFRLKKGFICENGEEITPKSFKSSLERSLRILAKKGGVPVFSKLLGYETFLHSNTEIQGLVASSHSLEFNFSSPVRSGLIQFLSFAPYGYICSENLTATGEWKNKEKFISSGPYRVKEIIIGEKYVLEKRQEWKDHKKPSPEIVNIIHKIPVHGTTNTPVIVDSYAALDVIPAGLTKYSLVPEYLNAVLLGNFKTGFFSDSTNRRMLRDSIERNKKIFPTEWKNHSQSSTFFSSQKKTPGAIQTLDSKERIPPAPLVIGGKEPTPETAGAIGVYIWPILKAALEELKWPFKFANNEPTWAEMTSQKYDIRMRSPSIGGGFEAWGINSLFCSSIGSGLPDPSGQICNLVNQFESDDLEEAKLAELFYEIVDRDSAIIPISHSGVQWYLSPEINLESVSPLVSVVRLDDLELK